MRREAMMNVTQVGLAAVAAAVVLAAPLEAQRRPLLQQQVRTSESALLVGGSRLDIEDLNARLAAFGYPSFDDAFLQLGLVRWTGRDRLQLGVELAGLVRPGATTDDFRYATRVHAGYGMLNIGYDVYRHGGLSVRPKLGLGAGAVMLAITDHASPGFDDILAQPGTDVRLGSGSLLLDGSVGVSYRMQPRTAPRGTRSLVLGARAGWTQSLLHGEWAREQSAAPGGPTTGWGGPHLELVVGRTTRR
jgi:hypothetical protein